MSKETFKFILASASPRRKELLEYFNIPIHILPSSIEEIGTQTIPHKLAVELAMLKGQDVLKSLTNNNDFTPIVLAADTIVALGDKIFGKPKSIEEAKSFLEELSGKTHQVYTGVYIGFKEHGVLNERIFYAKTQVEFEPIAADVLETYLETKDSLDKAGAYGIQNGALLFLKEIKGSYSNVVGLPLNLVVSEFKKIMDHKTPGEKQWQSQFI